MHLGDNKMYKFPLFFLVPLCFLSTTASYAIDNEKMPLLSEGGLRNRKVPNLKWEDQPGEDEVVLKNKATVTTIYQPQLDLYLDEFLRKQKEQRNRIYDKQKLIKDFYPFRKNEKKFISLFMFAFNADRQQACAANEVFKKDEHYIEEFGRRR